MPGGSCRWGNCEFYINSGIEVCDYWVVLYDLPEKDSASCPPSNTIFVTGEPISVKKYSKNFLKQFGTVITAQEHIAHPHVITTHQILPWYVHKTYDELVAMSPPEKKCLLSIVSSNKRFSKGHEQRYQFALALKSYFGDRIDLFGRGIRGFDDKWDVLAPYEYSIVIENSSSPYYVTEKLTEAFLSYTFPICIIPVVRLRQSISGILMVLLGLLKGFFQRRITTPSTSVISLLPAIFISKSTRYSHPYHILSIH